MKGDSACWALIPAKTTLGVPLEELSRGALLCSGASHQGCWFWIPLGEAPEWANVGCCL